MGTAHLALVHAGPGEADTVAPAGPTPQRVRIVDGALRCIARQGVAKTTLDDVARQAGCSRATVYRVFPGGKGEVLAAVADTETARLLSSIGVRMGEAGSLEEVLVAGVVEAARWLSDHRALQFLLHHEPEQLLPHLAFGHMDALLRFAARFTAPFLGRWLAPHEASRVAEWTARIVISYLMCPAEGIDLTDPDGARRMVRAFLLPGVAAVRSQHAQGLRRSLPGDLDAGGLGAGSGRRPTRRRPSPSDPSGSGTGGRSGHRSNRTRKPPTNQTSPPTNQTSREESS